MATFDVAKLLNKITQDIPGINTVLKALANWDVSALSDVPDGAMQATTDTSNRLTIRKKVSGSYAPVAKLMHDVDKVDGYHASTSATANTVAVRDSSGALPGNILGNAATANTATALATGSVVPVNQGGTGATTASQARANLGVADGTEFTTHIAKQASPSVEGHVKLDALAADGSNTAAPGGYGLGKTTGKTVTTTLNTCLEGGFYNLPSNPQATITDVTFPSIGTGPMLVVPRWNLLTQFYFCSGGFAYRRYDSSAGVWSDFTVIPNGITDSTATTSSKVAASATAVKKVNDATVHLAGNETITGDKSFAGQLYVKSTTPAIQQSHSDLTAGTPPSSDITYGGLLTRDNLGAELGGLSFVYRTTGERYCQIGFPNSAGTTRIWPFRIMVNQDDTSYATITTPPARDNSSKIATTAWVSANSLAVGDIIASFAATRAGCLLMNGSAVSRTTYANLFAIIGTAFGAGDGTTTFNLPNASDRVLQGANGNLMQYLAAGLPNITGRVNIGALGGAGSGALYSVTTGATQRSTTDTYSNSSSVNIDASRSSSIYGNSTTVQSPAIAVNYFIKY